MSVSIPASYYTNIHCSCHLARRRLHRPVPCSVHHGMYNYPDRPNREALVTSISLCGVLFRDPPSPTSLNKGWYSFAPW
ncbi:hypothetical protein C8R44DRAFT_976388 [Mycena epipterygia]|nr:hypothetical protein C8R44DRAFT_976388 [Mycena epipterygia]